MNKVFVLTVPVANFCMMKILCKSTWVIIYDRPRKASYSEELELIEKAGCSSNVPTAPELIPIEQLSTYHNALVRDFLFSRMY